MVITIVGIGVIGGSYALSLEKFRDNIYGIDINKKSLDIAKEFGIIKDGSLSSSKESIEIIKNTDLLIICVYPNKIKDFIEEYKEYFKESLIITDVVGIKEVYMNDIINLLPKGVDFVFAHPMAGREKKGLEYASKKIFKNANFLITPTPVNKEENIQLIENLANEMGFKNIKRVSPKEHDLIISFTSQLPHAIAVALINSDNFNMDTGAFIGDSYRDLTRIANINEELWSELFLGNKENLIERIDNFKEHLDGIRECLINEDGSNLKEIFIESSKRREKLEKL